MTRLIGQLADSIEIEEYMLFVEYSAVLTGCLELLAAFSGLERENITRGPAWLFLSLGRRLERALYSVRQMRELSLPLSEEAWPFLEYLLEVADSSITYRSRYFTTLQPVFLLDVLMADESNPRSLAFQLSHLADLYGKLPRHVPADLQAIRQAIALLRSVDLESLDYPLLGASKVHRESNGSVQLDRALDFIQELLPSWADNISHNYFSHARTLPITIDG